MAEVILYTKSYCPYSKECKKWLKEKGVVYDEKSAEDENLRIEMESKTGGRTDTPQVFVNGHYIGNYDDLKALEQQGKLEEMLNK